MLLKVLPTIYYALNTELSHTLPMLNEHETYLTKLFAVAFEMGYGRVDLAFRVYEQGC